MNWSQHFGARPRQRDLTEAEVALVKKHTASARGYLRRRGIYDGHSNFDVYWSYALEAVWMAVLKWEEHKGKLSTLLGRKLAGAYGDAGRELDYLTRTERRKVKAGSALDRGPVVSLSAGEEGYTLADRLPGRDRSIVFDLEVEDELRMLFGQMDDRDAAILLGSLGYEIRLGDLAVHFGITESRVCQIRQDLLKRLRASA